MQPAMSQRMTVHRVAGDGAMIGFVIAKADVVKRRKLLHQRQGQPRVLGIEYADMPRPRVAAPQLSCERVY